MDDQNVNNFLIVWLHPIATIIAVIITAWLSYIFGYRTQLRMATLKDRREEYGKLMGLKFSISQLYVSRFEAWLISDYHESRWKLHGKPPDSFDFQEAHRWMKSSENLALKIAEKNELLFSTIGRIKAVFRMTDELDELIERIYRFKIPKIEQKPENLDAATLETWKDTATTQLQELVKREITAPLEDLLDYLSQKGRLENT